MPAWSRCTTAQGLLVFTREGFNTKLHDDGTRDVDNDGSPDLVIGSDSRTTNRCCSEYTVLSLTPAPHAVGTFSNPCLRPISAVHACGRPCRSTSSQQTWGRCRRSSSSGNFGRTLCRPHGRALPGDPRRNVQGFGNLSQDLWQLEANHRAASRAETGPPSLEVETTGARRRAWPCRCCIAAGRPMPPKSSGRCGPTLSRRPSALRSRQRRRPRVAADRRGSASRAAVRLHSLGMNASTSALPGRNQPCHCGSGRKYKTLLSREGPGAGGRGAGQSLGRSRHAVTRCGTVRSRTTRQVADASAVESQDVSRLHPRRARERRARSVAAYSQRYFSAGRSRSHENHRHRRRARRACNTLGSGRAHARAGRGGNLAAFPPTDLHLSITTTPKGPVVSPVQFELVTGKYLSG